MRSPELAQDDLRGLAGACAEVRRFATRLDLGVNPTVLVHNEFKRRVELEGHIEAWAKGQDYAESLIERHAQRRMLSSQDRALLQAILFGVLRNRRLLDHWIGVLRCRPELSR